MKKRKTLLLPLARQFTVILILFTLCTVCITIYSTFGYSRLQTSFLNNSLESYSAQLAKSTREAYESYENICYSIAYSQVVQNYLMSENRGKSYENYRQLENQLSNTALLNPYIIDIAVYGQDSTFASLCGSASNYEEFSRSLSDSRFPYRSAGVATVNRTLCHVLAMPIYSLGTGESRYLGILFLAIDVNNLLGNSLKSDENDYDPRILFTDASGQLIYGEPQLYDALCREEDRSDVFQIQETSDNPVTYAVTGYSIPGIEHTLYVLIDKSQITRQVARISGRQLLVMCAITFLALLFLFLLYRPLIRSLKQLTDFMNTISSGDRRAMKEGAVIHQGLIGSKEISEISTAFNDMLIETEKLNHTIFDTYTRMYELENNNRKTEIAFLRSQINPHFLYNTLTMICGLAAEGMDDKIISVTGALSRIFRYSIKGSDMVTLEEEMSIVRSYLMIQKERFEDRFTVRYEFSEDSHDCLIPKMVIQPLVENAIVHGLEKSLEPGELLIGAGRNPEHGYLAIWIFDTGVGMPESRLTELRESIHRSVYNKTGDASADLEDLNSQNHESIGILNVNSRMVLYYGTDYTLLIDSEEGVGTNIQIRVPYRLKSDTNARAHRILTAKEKTMYQAIVIDDEKWVVKSLIATIRDQEYFEITAEFYDGLSGLEYIRAHEPCLAFVDVRLPGMGGLDILQAAHAENLSTLFIMISGHAEFAYAQKAMFHNAIGYCLKPFSRSELLDSMQKAYQLLEDQKEKTPEGENSSSPPDHTKVFVPRHLTASHKSVQMMIDYTEQHYQKDISIQDLAEHCSINANYASQIFKQEMGFTFISYLTGLRIDHATWLLTHTDQTVFLIATQVGYSDYFYFAKVFKKVTGRTPTAYRKDIEKTEDELPPSR